MPRVHRRPMARSARRLANARGPPEGPGDTTPCPPPRDANEDSLRSSWLVGVTLPRVPVGRPPRAEALLQRATTIAKSPRWHRVAADMASYRLDLRAALEHWQAVLRSEPLAVDAHEAFARLLAQMQGRAAALDHFTNVCARFPHQYRLRQLWLGWMGRVDEGLDEVEIAARLEPRGPMNFNLRGNLLENAHRPAEAQEQFRASLRLDVDQPWTIAALLCCCPDATAQRREVEFLRTEIRSQVLVGQSLLELQKVASTLVPAEELLADLESARTLRPELWEAWSACIQQLLVLRRLDAALDLAAAAVDRFPLLANAFRNLAAVHRARGDRKGERAALEQAVQLEPGSSESVMTLAESWEREGDRARAKELLQRLVAAAPLDAAAHAFVAQGFWKLGDKDLAIERLEHALRVNQESSLGWAQLGEWVGASKVAEFARHLTREKSWSCGGWLALAKFSPVLDERLDALAHAETCQPLHIEVHDLRALVLAEAGRFTEAFAACAPDVFGAERPIELRAREASIHAYQGDRDKAIAAMLEVVGSDPSFLWAIRCLIDWYREAGDATRLLEMAALGCNQDPTSAYLQGCVAEGRLLERNSAGAKAGLAARNGAEPSIPVGRPGPARSVPRGWRASGGFRGAGGGRKAPLQPRSPGPRRAAGASPRRPQRGREASLRHLHGRFGGGHAAATRGRGSCLRRGTLGEPAARRPGKGARATIAGCCRRRRLG